MKIKTHKRRRRAKRRTQSHEKPCARASHRFGEFHVPRGHYVFGFQRWWPDAPTDREVR